jgi:uncharacterized protein (DUF302 family)
MAESLGLEVALRESFAAALTRTREALKAEGFGILTEVDLQQIFRDKLGQEFRPYVMLGACNPPLAYRALSSAPEVGLLLPWKLARTGEVSCGWSTPISSSRPVAWLIGLKYRKSPRMLDSGWNAWRPACEAPASLPPNPQMQPTGRLSAGLGRHSPRRLQGTKVCAGSNMSARRLIAFR